MRLRRRPLVTLAALLAVLGLGLVEALPALAGETAAAPPVLAVHDEDVQQMVVDGDVQAGGVSTDGFTDSTAPSGSGARSAGGVSVVAGWVLPARGRLGDPFGPRPQQPVPGVSLYHRGQDIVAPCGSAVHAAADGVVQTAAYWGTYGNWILVDHGHGVATGYAHEMRMLVVPGQHVRAGQTIGLVGETGAATGCHLHLEAHLNGVAVNPVPFFASRGIVLGR